MEVRDRSIIKGLGGGGCWCVSGNAMIVFSRSPLHVICNCFRPPPPPTPTDNFPESKHASINWPLYTLLGIFILFRGYNNQVPSNHEPCGSLPRPCLNDRSTHLTFGFLDLFFLVRARTPNLFKYPKVLLKYLAC